MDSFGCVVVDYNKLAMASKIGSQEADSERMMTTYFHSVSGYTRKCIREPVLCN
jgi:hypothetical protein